MKFNWKNFIILLIGLIAFILCISDWIIVLIFNGTFTTIGITINIIEMVIASISYDYLEGITNA